MNTDLNDYKTIYFENDEIKLTNQPSNLKIKLFPHQLASIYQLEEREKNWKISV